MSPDHPAPDAHHPNAQLPPNFTLTPGLTPVPSSFPSSPNSELHRALTLSLNALYTTHALTATRHLGLFHAGSRLWTSLPNRPCTLVCVCELLGEQLHRWRDIDAPLRALLLKEGYADVPVRYYEYWTPCTFHLGEPDQETGKTFNEGPVGWTASLAQGLQRTYRARMRLGNANEAATTDLPDGERRTHSNAATTRLHARALARAAARERAARRVRLGEWDPANFRETLGVPPAGMGRGTALHTPPPYTPPTHRRQDSSGPMADSSDTGVESANYVHRRGMRGAARVARFETAEVRATGFSAVLEGVGEGDGGVEHWAEAQPMVEEAAAVGRGGVGGVGVANDIPEYDPTPRLGLREMAEEAHASRHRPSAAQSADHPPARRLIAYATAAVPGTSSGDQPQSNSFTAAEQEAGVVLPWYSIDTEGSLTGRETSPPRYSALDHYHGTPAALQAAAERSQDSGQEGEDIGGAGHGVFTRYPAWPHYETMYTSREAAVNENYEFSDIHDASAADVRIPALAQEEQEVYRLHWPSHHHASSSAPLQPGTGETRRRSQSRGASAGDANHIFQRDRPPRTAHQTQLTPGNRGVLRIQTHANGARPPPHARANMDTADFIAAYGLPESFRIFDGGPVPQASDAGQGREEATPRTLPTQNAYARELTTGAVTTDPYATTATNLDSQSGDDINRVRTLGRSEGAWPPMPSRSEIARMRREYGLASPLEWLVPRLYGDGEGGKEDEEIGEEMLREG